MPRHFRSRQRRRHRRRTQQDCGPSLLGSLARYDHDSRSWRTPQCSLLAGLDVYSETWPRWGMMRGGVCWAQSTPARRIGESESGLWPSPKARDAKPEGLAAGRRRDSPNLTTVVLTPSMWPTPTVAHQDSSLCKLWASGTEQPPEDSWLSNPNQVAEITQEVADINVPQRKGSGVPSGIYSEHANTNQPGSWWATDPADAIESSVGRVANGVAARVDRLKAIGNGQVPAVAALAWNVLKPIPERLVVHPVP
jgi:hypothetical protein